MLTSRAIRQSHARHYYEAESSEPPMWSGEGAKILGLSGALIQSDFNSLVNNRLIGPPKTGYPKVGLDLTFSAPKSVSLLGLVDQNQKVLDADKAAVQATLHKIDSEFVRIRCHVDGARKTFFPGASIYAEFFHATSRTDDPQRHTHVILFNAAHFQNQWRAILDRGILTHIKKLGQFYREHLAENLKSLGYKPQWKENGLFELAGYTVKQLQGFSIRRSQIEDELNTGKSLSAQIACLKTRPQKSGLSVEELRPWWQERAKELEVQHPIPSLDAERDDLKPAHLHELVDKSGIDPALAKLNFESIEGREVLERLTWHKIPEDGQAAQYWTCENQKKLGYWRDSSVCNGGLWCKGGVDAQDLKTNSLWGSYKPDKEHARFDSNRNRPIKYEHPLGEKSRRIFLLKPTEEIAQKILEAHGVKAREGETFWETVVRAKLPITITEGAKKTAALLSNGVITVGVSGVNSTYYKTDHGRELHPDLNIFTGERKITFAYDQDSTLETKRNVRREMVRGAELFAANGATVDVKKWSWKDGKGVDDLIVNRGFKAYEQAKTQDWTIERHAHYKLQFNKLMRIVQPKADPDKELIGVAFIAIARYGVKDAIRIVAQSEAVKASENQKDAIISIFEGLHQRLSQKYEVSLQHQEEADEEL